MLLKKASASRINSFFTCRARFGYHYYEGHTIMPTAALTLGTAVHKGVNFNMDQKIESHEDLPEADVLDAFGTCYDRESHRTIWMPKDKPGKIKDVGYKLMGTHHSDVAPGIQPVAAEKYFEMRVAEYDFPFEGYIDVIDDDDLLMELKTSSSSPACPSPENMLQATLYALGYRYENEGTEKGVEFQFLVKNKTPIVVKFQRQLLSTDFLFLKNMIDALIVGCKDEYFPPNRNFWGCSKRWCGFWEMCERDWSGSVRD